MKSSPLLLIFLAALACTPAAAQDKSQLLERTEEQILKTVTLPAGFAATVFARAPRGGYPTSVSAAIDGTIFVAIDENGSLGRDRNPSSIPAPPDSSARVPGKVVRMRDTDGDGRADEFKTFAEMESPRGVIWDGPGMSADGKMPGTLYVMHPPNLTAYTDTDGDGAADQQEDILTGLGFGLEFRGADHTTNGCRLAIDGFIYIAVGDYGFINARAKDGTTLTNRGGGIVRIRPDGTGFEIVSRGQRNIYDVAVSPTLDLFTRDNTNDGGGWNVRLSHVPPGAQMGYPHLFKNFPEDILPPLADFGGGSPCGALWLDEPGLPNGLLTVEWGRNAIMYHALKQKGAGWEVAASPLDTDPKLPGQQEWLKLTRPTDMDADASGALFITSWEGATFNYNGPNAGYVLRVANKAAAKVAVVDLGTAGAAGLGGLITGSSAVLRLAAQREIFRRMPLDIRTLKLNSPNAAGPAVIVATHQTIKMVQGQESLAALSRYMVERESEREFAIAAEGDARLAPFVIPEHLMEGLSDKRPRVRAAAITALRRLSFASNIPSANLRTIAIPRKAAPAILPLVADADPVVAHLAIRALSELNAAEECLAALDAAVSGRVGVPPAGSGVSPERTSQIAAIADGALRSLYGIYQPEVVAGLIDRLRGLDADQLPKDRSGKMPEPAGGTPTLPGNAAAADAVPSANARGSFDLRRGILNALCRLANQDAPYTDPKVWWGTRPDTSGPVYQPIAWSETPKITAALQTALAASDADDAKWLVERMYATKVAYPGLVELMLAKAGTDTPAKLTALEGMVRADNSLPPEGVLALQAIAIDEKEAPELRVRALRVFQKCADNGSVFLGSVAAFAPLAGHDIADAKIRGVFEDFTRSAVNGKWVGDYAKALAADDAPKRLLAATVLVNLSTGKVGRENEREAAKKAVDKGFARPESAAALLTAIARTGAKPLAEKVKAHLNHPNNAVAESALFAFQKLGLQDTAAPAKSIGELKHEEVVAAVQKGGDAKAGQELYLRAGCIACHTVQADEPPKGPILSAVAKIYDRAALTESILKPNAKLAQGFESAFFTTKKGETIEGFVTREGGDSVDVRNIAGQTVTLEKGDIAERGHRPQSMMPEGLMNTFTPAELASLLAWMESLRK